MSDLKKKKQKHNTVLRVASCFISGKVRTITLGDSISDSSEKLLQRGRGKVNIWDFGEGRVCAVNHISLKKVAASHKDQTSP